MAFNNIVLKPIENNTGFIGCKADNSSSQFLYIGNADKSITAFKFDFSVIPYGAVIVSASLHFTVEDMSGLYSRFSTETPSQSCPIQLLGSYNPKFNTTLRNMVLDTNDPTLFDGQFITQYDVANLAPNIEGTGEYNVCIDSIDLAKVIQDRLDGYVDGNMNPLYALIIKGVKASESEVRRRIYSKANSSLGPYLTLTYQSGRNYIDILRLRKGYNTFLRKAENASFRYSNERFIRLYLPELLEDGGRLRAVGRSSGESVGVSEGFGYSGTSVNYVVPSDGVYKFEVWGAEGASNVGNSDYSGITAVGGKGGYARGEMYLNAGQTLGIYVGGRGRGIVGGFNGGGGTDLSQDSHFGAGGGCSDIRVGSTRLIIAGGGGGNAHNGNGGAGGGLVGINSGSVQNGYGKAGSQTDGYALYQGGEPFRHGGGGGGGYYGGQGGYDCADGGAGGSSYIAGLTNGVTFDGNTGFPAPGGGYETGHSGDGYIKITSTNVTTGNVVCAAGLTNEYEGDTGLMVRHNNTTYEVTTYGTKVSMDEVIDTVPIVMGEAGLYPYSWKISSDLVAFIRPASTDGFNDLVGTVYTRPLVLNKVLDVNEVCISVVSTMFECCEWYLYMQREDSTWVSATSYFRHFHLKNKKFSFISKPGIKVKAFALVPNTYAAGNSFGMGNHWDTWFLRVNIEHLKVRHTNYLVKI